MTPTKQTMAGITTDKEHTKNHYDARRTPSQDQLQAQDKSKTKNSVVLLGKEFPCTQQNGNYFVSCKEIFSFVGLESHVKNRGYKHIDSKVEKAGLNVNEEFICENNGSRRTLISLKALAQCIQSKVKLIVVHY